MWTSCGTHPRSYSTSEGLAQTSTKKSSCVQRMVHHTQRYFSTAHGSGDNDSGGDGTSQQPQAPLTQEEKHQKLFTEGPYPDSINHSRNQARFSYRPSKSPDDTSVILFPGYGTQFVGMGSELLDLPSVQSMFMTASEILGFDLLEACMNGPDLFLSRTQVHQPAILVCSLAALDKLRADNPAAVENCVGTAGFSVGEITALTFAGALSFEDAVRLVKVRSEAMQEVSEQTPGGLATVFTRHNSKLGLCCEAAKEFCRRRNVFSAECKVANYLGPDCKVVGGSEEALQFLSDNMADFKLKRVNRLNVCGAFHTNHMKPVADAIRNALRDIKIHSPSIPVHSNIDGKPYIHSHLIRRNLQRQVYCPVRWEQTLHILYERHPGQSFPRTYECGPGRSLITALKMVNEKAAEHAFHVAA
ncbi:Acyl transferase [Trinorchestia longiramus]|nr:Acyl transferase [Trinorchestia longiramus]